MLFNKQCCSLLHNIVHWVQHNIAHSWQHNIVHWVQHDIVHSWQHNIFHSWQHNIVHACLTTCNRMCASTRVLLTRQLGLWSWVYTYKPLVPIPTVESHWLTMELWNCASKQSIVLMSYVRGHLLSLAYTSLLNENISDGQL